MRNETGESIIGQLDEQQEQQVRRRNLSAPGQRYGRIVMLDNGANCFSAVVMKSHSDNEVLTSETPPMDIGTATPEQNTPRAIDTSSSQHQRNDVSLSSSAPYDSDVKKFTIATNEDDDDDGDDGSSSGSSQSQLRSIHTKMQLMEKH